MTVKDGVGATFYKEAELQIVWTHLDIIKVTNNGDIVSSTGNYRPRYCFIVNDTLGILELETDEDAAEWIIDQSGRLLDNDIARWINASEMNREAFALLLLEIHRRLTVDSNDKSSIILGRFSRLSAKMQSRILKAIGVEHISSWLELSFKDFMSSKLPIITTDMYKICKNLLECNGVDILQTWSRLNLSQSHDGVEFPSSLDLILTFNACYIFNTLFYGYDITFGHERQRAIFIMSNHDWGDFQPAAIIFVNEGIVVYADLSRDFLVSFWSTTAQGLLCKYLAENWCVLSQVYENPPLTRSTAIIGNIFYHIGHCLINELTGLDNLVRSGDINHIDHILYLDGSEPIYGDIKDIFPELNHKLIPSDFMSDDFACICLTKGIFLFRITGRFVSRNLAQRIIKYSYDVVRESGSLLIQNNTIDMTEIICLVGLRFENRHALNIRDILINTVQHLTTRYTKVTLVFDGHNRTNTKHVRVVSSLEEFSNEECLNREYKIVKEIQDSLLDTPKVEIISLIDCSVAASVIWATKANFGIAFWGAGLAKSRWIANLPTFIITSAYNLANLTDKMIYSSEEFMENPSISAFASADIVHDCSDEPILIGEIQPENALFEVNLQGYEKELSLFLDTLHN